MYKILIRPVVILALPIFVFASFYRATGNVQSTALEKVKFITSTGIENFVKDLNANGSLGYRLEKSLNYGGEGALQTFAAVLRLDAPNKYEYDWMSSPETKHLDARLNYQAKQGYNYTNAYALTHCSGDSSGEEAESSSVASLIVRLNKGDAFLMERKNGSTEQTKEYKVFTAKVRLGDSAEKDIQAGLAAAAPQGFRPVKILFAREGMLTFRIAVLAERTLPENNDAKAEYRFLKKTSGLPKDINSLAAQGFRFITGRRVGMIGLVLMEKRTADATTYLMIEEKKHAKEFDKTIAQGNRYEAVMIGDLTCGSAEAENERLVFAQSAEKRDYKVKAVAFTKTGSVEPEALNEFQRMVGDGYQVKDLFYSGGLNLIFEK